MNVPVFTSSDEVKRKDCVRELHPQIYPFTEEDGKTEPFKGKLDFSAFTFPEENTSLISEQALREYFRSARRKLCPTI